MLGCHRAGSLRSVERRRRKPGQEMQWPPVGSKDMFSVVGKQEGKVARAEAPSQVRCGALACDAVSSLKQKARSQVTLEEGRTVTLLIGCTRV